jgi:hypothetical protein
MMRKVSAANSEAARKAVATLAGLPGPPFAPAAENGFFTSAEQLFLHKNPLALALRAVDVHSADPLQ